jgi:hypothetical protein
MRNILTKPRSAKRTFLPFAAETPGRKGVKQTFAAVAKSFEELQKAGILNFYPKF